MSGLRNTTIFRTEHLFFHKGPLIEIYCDENYATYESTTPTILSYKIFLKQMLINQQSSGDDESWPNFILNSIQGLRKSERLQKGDQK